jgi:hypothetical protein
MDDGMEDGMDGWKGRLPQANKTSDIIEVDCKGRWDEMKISIHPSRHPSVRSSM